jgi:hypothetical protein
MRSTYGDMTLVQSFTICQVRIAVDYASSSALGSPVIILLLFHSLNERTLINRTCQANSSCYRRLPELWIYRSSTPLSFASCNEINSNQPRAHQEQTLTMPWTASKKRRTTSSSQTSLRSALSDSSTEDESDGGKASRTSLSSAASRKKKRLGKLGTSSKTYSQRHAKVSAALSASPTSTTPKKRRPRSAGNHEKGLLSCSSSSDNDDDDQEEGLEEFQRDPRWSSRKNSNNKNVAPSHKSPCRTKTTIGNSYPHHSSQFSSSEKQRQSLLGNDVDREGNESDATADIVRRLQATKAARNHLSPGSLRRSEMLLSTKMSDQENIDQQKQAPPLERNGHPASRVAIHQPPTGIVGNQPPATNKSRLSAISSPTATATIHTTGKGSLAEGRQASNRFRAPTARFGVGDDDSSSDVAEKSDQLRPDIGEETDDADSIDTVELKRQLHSTYRHNKKQHSDSLPGGSKVEDHLTTTSRNETAFPSTTASAVPTSRGNAFFATSGGGGQIHGMQAEDSGAIHRPDDDADSIDTAELQQKIHSTFRHNQQQQSPSSIGGPEEDDTDEADDPPTRTTNRPQTPPARPVLVITQRVPTTASDPMSASKKTKRTTTPIATTINNDEGEEDNFMNDFVLPSQSDSSSSESEEDEAEDVLPRGVGIERSPTRPPRTIGAMSLSTVATQNWNHPQSTNSIVRPTKPIDDARTGYQHPVTGYSMTRARAAGWNGTISNTATAVFHANGRYWPGSFQARANLAQPSYRATTGLSNCGREPGGDQGRMPAQPYLETRSEEDIYNNAFEQISEVSNYEHGPGHQQTPKPAHYHPMVQSEEDLSHDAFEKTVEVTTYGNAPETDQVRHCPVARSEKGVCNDTCVDSAGLLVSRSQSVHPDDESEGEKSSPPSFLQPILEQRSEDDLWSDAFGFPAAAATTPTRDWVLENQQYKRAPPKTSRNDLEEEEREQSQWQRAHDKSPTHENEQSSQPFQSTDCNTSAEPVPHQRHHRRTNHCPPAPPDHNNIVDLCSDSEKVEEKLFEEAFPTGGIVCHQQQQQLQARATIVRRGLRTSAKSPRFNVAARGFLKSPPPQTQHQQKQADDLQHSFLSVEEVLETFSEDDELNSGAYTHRPSTVKRVTEDHATSIGEFQQSQPRQVRYMLHPQLA